jgi:hypothetical protein
MQSFSRPDNKPLEDKHLEDRIKILFDSTSGDRIIQSLKDLGIALHPLMNPQAQSQEEFPSLGDPRAYAMNSLVFRLIHLIKNSRVQEEHIDERVVLPQYLPLDPASLATLSNKAYWQRIDECLVSMQQLLNDLMTHSPAGHKKFNKIKAAFVSLLGAMAAGLLAAGLGAAGLTIAGVAVTTGIVMYAYQHHRYKLFKPALQTVSPHDAKMSPHAALKQVTEAFIQNIREGKAKLVP